MIQVLEILARFARDVGAKSVRPLSDGALRIVYDSNARLPDGTSLVELMPGTRAVVVWMPTAREGTPKVEGIGGAVIQRGLDRESFMRVLRRLAEVCPSWALYSIRPFTLRTEERIRFALDEGFIRNVLGAYLIESVTAIGPYLLEPIETNELGVEVKLSDGCKTIGLYISASDDGDFRIGPLKLKIVGHTASVLERLALDYIFYALCRSVRDGDEIVPLQARCISEPDSEPLPKKRPARNVREQRAIDPLADLMDERDRGSEWVFIRPPHYRSEGSREINSALLEADNGVAFVGHYHVGCLTRMPLCRARLDVGHMWDAFDELPIMEPESEGKTTVFTSERGLILGQDEEVRSAAEVVARRPTTKVLTTMYTCFSELIGLDAEDAAFRTFGIPCVAWTVNQRSFAQVSEFWANVLKAVDKEVRPEPGVVNLVGVAPADSRVAREIALDLEKIGISVNGFLIPSIRTNHLDRFLAAAATVVAADRLVLNAFKNASEILEGHPIIKLSPPFGPNFTMAFYEQVARAAGVLVSFDAITRLWMRYMDEWERWRRRAERHGVAIVVRPEDVPNLTTPENLYGLDVISLCREMGFFIEIFCVPSDSQNKSADEGEKDLIEYLTRTRPSDDRVTVICDEFAASPIEILRSSKASLVFTEFVPDSRVHKAGKLGIHPRCFERGLAGAIRTIRRLVRLAESEFFRVWS